MNLHRFFYLHFCNLFSGAGLLDLGFLKVYLGFGQTLLLGALPHGHVKVVANTKQLTVVKFRFGKNTIDDRLHQLQYMFKC